MAQRKILLAVGLAILVSILVTSIGLAHARQIRSDPADGSVLAESPREIRIWFDEPLSDRFNSVQLFDADSHPLAVPSVRKDLGDPTLLVITIPELPDGVYSVLWKILSEVDGHYSQGLLVFGVGEGADLGSASAAPVEDPAPSAWEVLFRWLNLLALSGLAGGIAMIQLVLRPAWSQAKFSALSPAIFEIVIRRLLDFALRCALGGILVWVFFLLWQSVVLGGSILGLNSLFSVIQQTLTQTHWGTNWQIRQLLLLIAGMCVYYVRRKQNSAMELLNRSMAVWYFLIAICLMLIVVQSLSSHAAGPAADNALTVTSDGLHLLGATLWMGGLLSLGFVLLPLIRKNRVETGYLIQVGWRPFSKITGLSIGVLIATGVFNTGHQVVSIDALISSLYGLALLLKLGLLLIIAYLGFLSTSLLHPSLFKPMKKRFGSRAGWTPLEVDGLPRHVMIRAGLSTLILLITGLITAAPPPRDLKYTVDPEDVPGSLSQTVEDVVVTLSAKPNRPGQNVFTVFAASTRRPPPAEIARVLLRFTYLDRNIGSQSVTLEEVEPGRFLLGGDHLKLAGNWQIDVVVRRPGMEDSVARFNWVVAPPGIASPVLVSKAPWTAVLSLIAAGLLLCIPLHGLIVFSVKRRNVIRRESISRERPTIFVRDENEKHEDPSVVVTVENGT